MKKNEISKRQIVLRLKNSLTSFRINGFIIESLVLPY